MSEVPMYRFSDAAATAALAATKPDPSSISHARFSSMSARLAQIAAKVSADSLSEPASAHDAVPMERVARFLGEVWRITDAIFDTASGGLVTSETEL